MQEASSIFTLSILGYKLGITMSILVQWVIIGIVFILALMYSKRINKVPDRIQSAVEVVIEFISSNVESNMGEGKQSFVPYIGSLAVYLFLLNMVGLIGIKPPTGDYSVALALGLSTFLVIQGYTIKKLGIWKYFKGYASPMPLLLPINIMERVMLPVSLSLRLFGNIFAATMIMELLYEMLTGITFFAGIAIPLPFNFYFDVFDGAIQMVIFVMLTMVNIKVVSEH